MSFENRFDPFGGALPWERSKHRLPGVLSERSWQWQVRRTKQSSRGPRGSSSPATCLDQWSNSPAPMFSPCCIPTPVSQEPLSWSKGIVHLGVTVL